MSPHGPTAPARERALLATDLLGKVVVLATDGAAVAYMADAVSTDADECGLVDSTIECREPGLWLWEGTASLEYETHEATYPTETVFRGAVRRVKAEEVAELYGMEPPEPEGGE